MHTSHPRFISSRITITSPMLPVGIAPKPLTSPVLLEAIGLVGVQIKFALIFTARLFSQALGYRLGGGFGLGAVSSWRNAREGGVQAEHAPAIPGDLLDVCGGWVRLPASPLALRV
jgi:hypothetical protein